MKNGTKEMLFSVMRDREDLPRMPGGMAAVFLLLAALAAAASAKLASPADGSAAFASQNLAGILACLPFLPLAVTLYALTILLWRRVASLLCTPVSFGLMLLFGARFSDACGLTLAILPVSYAFAVSLISKETRFRRTATLGLFAAAAFGLASVARIGLDCGSFTGLRDAFMSEVPPIIGSAVTTAVPGAESVLADSDLYNLARQIFVMLPSFFGVFCVVFAWACDRIIRLLFVWLSCQDIFIDTDEDVSTPFSYAAVYAVVFLATVLTPASVFPMARAMFQSVLLVMGLPCAAVGVRRMSEGLSERLFYMTREKFFIGMLLFVGFAALGAFPFLLVTSAVGAVSIIRRRFRPTSGPGEGEE